jgi:hypothetical protein
MKRMLFVFVMTAVLIAIGSAQYKAQRSEGYTNVGQAVTRSSDGLLFGWFDPSRLTMRHSYSLSYSSFGGQGLSVGMYTNSLFYKISGPLDVQFDVSLIHSPFGSFAGAKNFSGISLSRAELNYRPAENMWFRVQFRQLPAMYWMGSGYGMDLYDRFPDNRPEEDR